MDFLNRIFKKKQKCPFLGNNEQRFLGGPTTSNGVKSLNYKWNELNKNWEALNNQESWNFWFNLAAGNLTGLDRAAVGGNNPEISTNTKENLWYQKGVYSYASSDSTWYISSSNNSDNQIIAISGLDGDYNKVTRIAILNGQTKTAITGELLRSSIAFNLGSTDIQGDLYIYEDDTVVAGVPSTQSKIKHKAPAGTNQSVVCSYTAPAGKNAYIHQISGSMSKAKDADFIYRFRLLGGTLNEAFPFNIYQGVFNYFQAGFVVPAKSDSDFIALTGDGGVGSSASAGFEVVEFDE